MGSDSGGLCAGRGVHLSTARLALSHWTEDDLPLAQRLWGDPAVMRLLGGALTEADVAARLRLEIKLQREFGVQYWPLFVRDGGAFAGCAGLRPFPYPEPVDQHTFELGAHLLPEFWGGGIALEVGEAILHFAFDALGARAVWSGHHPQNGASRGVLARARFRFQSERFYAPTGLQHPYYRLTAEEFHTDRATSG